MSPKIGIDPSDNPEFGDIHESYSAVMERWGQLNEQIHKFDVPRLCWTGTVENLESIGREIDSLTKDWLVLHHKARNFHANPRYTISEEVDRDLTFLNYQQVLMLSIIHTENSMTVLQSNYNLTYADLRHRRSYNIAVTSFGLAIVSLVVSLVMAG